MVISTIQKKKKKKKKKEEKRKENHPAKTCMIWGPTLQAEMT
jgi:hypothetical protein